MRSEPPNPFDRALKVLIRRALPTLLRLAGVDVDPAQVHPDDTAINMAEYRADHLFRIGEQADPDYWALHLEYQFQPDPRVVPDWLYKNAALNKRLDMPVILLAVYLTRGDRATFPGSHTIRGGGLTNQHQFETLRLWEHADRIRGGDFRELAPLLLLCDDTPREATLRQERELILSLQAPQPIQADLLAVAVMVGIRFFARDLVEAVFAEEMQMLKESSFIEEWIEEAVARATTDAEAQSARRFLLRQLRHRFGALPDEVVEQIGTAGREWCEAMGERLLDATSLEELGFGGNGAHPS